LGERERKERWGKVERESDGHLRRMDEQDTSDGVDFVEEEDAGLLRLRKREDLADHACSLADVAGWWEGRVVKEERKEQSKG
jgi:hypothetical protein